jgi:hypothetical protein
MIKDYQIILIIISIITLIITISLYIFFIYIPAARAADQLDVLVVQGTNIINVVDNAVESVQEAIPERVDDVCKGICSFIFGFNEFADNTPFFGGCVLLNTNKAIPSYCPESYKDPIGCANANNL